MTKRHIGFNKPYLTGKETKYILESVETRKISGDGLFTKRCHDFFEKRFGFKKVLLTTSCTDALEMAAILINTNAGDEIIAPSYTFVSSVNAFVLRGAKIVFCDSETDTPNIDISKIEELITPKTKAIKGLRKYFIKRFQRFLNSLCYKKWNNKMELSNMVSLQ